MRSSPARCWRRRTSPWSNTIWRLCHPVTWIADAGGISVRMAGRALTDGLVNQRVKVVNLSSGKVVEGIARSAQVVEIIF